VVCSGLLERRGVLDRLCALWWIVREKGSIRLCALWWIVRKKGRVVNRPFGPADGEEIPVKVSRKPRIEQM